jgi:hypothetical protein
VADTWRGPGRTHDGIMIALRSNPWCSDHLACRNGAACTCYFLSIYRLVATTARHL